MPYIMLHDQIKFERGKIYKLKPHPLFNLFCQCYCLDSLPHAVVTGHIGHIQSVFSLLCVVTAATRMSSEKYSTGTQQVVEQRCWLTYHA